MPKKKYVPIKGCELVGKKGNSDNFFYPIRISGTEKIKSYWFMVVSAIGLGKTTLLISFIKYVLWK